MVDAGKDGEQEEKGVTDDEMVGWHHPRSGHEFERTPGDGEGQGSLACCSPRGRRGVDTTRRLNKDSTGDAEAAAQLGPHSCPSLPAALSDPSLTLTGVGSGREG